MIFYIKIRILCTPDDNKILCTEHCSRIIIALNLKSIAELEIARVEENRIKVK